MLTLLHLSDLHFTTGDAGTQFDLDEKIREALFNDLGKEERTNFDAILITGDITYHGRTDEFDRAKAWFEEIRIATSCAPEALFVVPGNHDVNQGTVSKDSSLWELHQSLRGPIAPQARLESLHKKLRDPFDFLAAQTEYRAFASAYGCPTSPKELAWVQVLDRPLEDGSRVRLHGLNTALISDGEDKKANLFLGTGQFHHFDSHPGYVNVVLCHHPHAWLLDGNEANDYFRNQAQVILTGHDHDVRCYMEGGSLRLFAGAVHPNRRTRWEPCYHVVRLSISSGAIRELVVTVETRVWRDKDKYFAPYVQPNLAPRHEERVSLPPWTPAPPGSPVMLPSSADPKDSQMSPDASVPATLTTDAFAAARRKLIVHFFRLGVIARYKAVVKAGVWDESDDALDGQARWARVFERAERERKFGAVWNAVVAEDETLHGQPNPFETGS